LNWEPTDLVRPVLVAGADLKASGSAATIDAGQNGLADNEYIPVPDTFMVVGGLQRNLAILGGAQSRGCAGVA
jgi:hypothetical protein